MDDPRREDELQLDEQSISDLDVPDEDAASVRGGRDDVVRQEPPVPTDGGTPDAGTQTPRPPWSPPPGGSQIGTGCSGGYSKRKGCR